MSEHYTRNTLECTAWCNRCNRFTQHRVDHGRKGPCLEHETAVKTSKGKRPKDQQGDLFAK